MEINKYTINQTINMKCFTVKMSGGCLTRIRIIKIRVF